MRDALDALERELVGLAPVKTHVREIAALGVQPDVIVCRCERPLPASERAKIALARSVAGDVVPAAALCYVWDGTLPAGTTLWNAYTDRVRMIVVESGAARRGEWVNEERDVAADFRAAFGEEPPPISGVAIAADTDQTGETVRAWFGDIRFAPR